MDIDETRIKQILSTQRDWAIEAKRMADQGYLEKVMESLLQVRFGKDEVYGLLSGLTREDKGIQLITGERFRMMEQNRDHYFAKETQRIYDDAVNHCSKILGDKLY